MITGRSLGSQFVVDRHDPIRRKPIGLLGDLFPFRALNLDRPESGPLGLPKDDHRAAHPGHFGKLLHQERLLEEDDLGDGGLVVYQDTCQREVLAAGGDHFRCDDAAANRSRLAGHEVDDVPEPGPVLIPPGRVAQHVARGKQPYLGEGLGEGGANTLYELYLIVEGLGVRRGHLEV